MGIVRVHRARALAPHWSDSLEWFFDFWFQVCRWYIEEDENEQTRLAFVWRSRSQGKEQTPQEKEIWDKLNTTMFFVKNEKVVERIKAQQAKTEQMVMARAQHWTNLQLMKPGNSVQNEPASAAASSSSQLNPPIAQESKAEGQQQGEEAQSAEGQQQGEEAQSSPSSSSLAKKEGKPAEKKDKEKQKDKKAETMVKKDQKAEKKAKKTEQKAKRGKQALF